MIKKCALWLLLCCLPAIPVSALAVTGADLIAWSHDAEQEKSTFNSGRYMGYVAAVAEDVMRRELVCVPRGTAKRDVFIAVASFLHKNQDLLGLPATTLVMLAMGEEYPCEE